MVGVIPFFAIAFSSTASLTTHGPLLTTQLSLHKLSVQALSYQYLRGGSVNLVAAPPAGVLLGLTIALEVAATTCMKLSVHNRLWNVGVFSGYILCFSIFPAVLRKIPLGVAYAIWSGSGTALTCLVGRLIFGETLNLRKMLFLAMIILRVIGLNLSSGGAGHA